MIKGIDKLQKLIKALEQMPKKTVVFADQSIVSNSEELIDLNRKQLATGRDGDERALQYKKRRKGELNSSNSYTRAYDRYKSKRGGQTNFVDLNLSGDYLRSLKLEKVKPNIFKIESDQGFGGYYGNFSLQEELEYNYGKNIHKISDNSMRTFANEALKPDIEIRIENELRRI